MFGPKLLTVRLTRKKQARDTASLAVCACVACLCIWVYLARKEDSLAVLCGVFNPSICKPAATFCHLYGLWMLAVAVAPAARTV